MYAPILLSLLISSITANVGLFYYLKKKPKRAQSIELQEFLSDLMSGPGMVAVARVDPNNLLLRSPKQK